MAVRRFPSRLLAPIALEEIVLDGRFLPQGMPDFGDRLTREQAKLIRNYVVSRSSRV